jgi:hypothetical protein
MLAEPQWAMVFAAAKKRGARWSDLADVNAFKAEVEAALAAGTPVEAPTARAGGREAPFGLKAFFDALRGGKTLGPTLSTDEVEGCQAILNACRAAGWGTAWTAYALATAYHETAGTMRPIREYGRGKGRKYGVKLADGQVAYGRGYVQLTWLVNYQKADAKLGLGGRLVRDFDLALDPKVAADIMVRGMAEGWFTGKKLADTLPVSGPATQAQFVASRPIINGRDKAELIARHAMEFQRALVAGNWEGA